MKVQLGFAETAIHDETDDDFLPLGHRSPNWCNWDGGKIGGVPSWLNPRDLPSQSLQCVNCETKMRFLAQLYCPLDDIDAAFHRSLYVFICPNSSKQCYEANHDSNQSNQCNKGIRILRCQLPRCNPFYPHDMNDDDNNDNDSPYNTSIAIEGDVEITTVNHLSTDGWNIQLCRVCGQRGQGKCPKQNQWFCGKACQKEHFKFIYNNHYDNDEDTNDTLFHTAKVPSIYTEMELVVEEEPPSSSAAAAAAAASPLVSSNTTINNKLLKQMNKKAWFDSTNQEQDEDGDEDLEQADLNQITGIKEGGGTTDDTTFQFFQRIDRFDTLDPTKTVKNQCLRYQRWVDVDDLHDDTTNIDANADANTDAKTDANGPLWINSQQIPQSNKDIPNCPYCGGERKFEFQLMPQLLNYLKSSYHSLSPSSTTTTPHGTNADADANANDPKLISHNISQDVKNAIMAMSDIREKEGDENIKPEYIQQHEESLALMKDHLLNNNDNHLINDIHNTDANNVDFGVIAVYTCVNSCDTNPIHEDNRNALGAYMEEFAWRQPPLD